MADPVWLDLFDPFYAQSAVEQLREDMNAPQVSNWHIWARNSLLPDIASYIEDHGGFTSNRTNIEAANALSQFTYSLARRVARRQILDTDPTELEQLWLAFVAHGAAYRIYHDLPRVAARRSEGTKNSIATRQRQHNERLDQAARALNRLRENNDMKFHSLAKIAEETKHEKDRAPLKLTTVQSLKKAVIEARADELRAD